MFQEVKDLIEKKDINGAKAFIEEHKEELGEYLEHAKALLEGNDMVNDVVGKFKDLLGK